MHRLSVALGTLLAKFGFSRTQTRSKLSSHGYNRKLRIEQCEDRRMLAAFSVTNTSDAVVTSPGDAPGTLRQAIFDANDADNLGGIPDIITFDPTFFDTPQTINLAHGELNITEAVTIDTVGQDITIDANNGSRVFTINASSSSGEVKLSGLTITGGDSSLNGGGLYFDSSAFPSGDVTLTPY